MLQNLIFGTHNRRRRGACARIRPDDGLALDDSAPRAVHAFWLSVVGLVVHGWIYSYFWTSATII